jgi:undecaprenyl-diphosphatase
MTIDKIIFQAINGLAHQWWFLDWLGVFLANYLSYFLILIAVFVLIKEKKWRQRIYFFCLALLSVILARGIIVETIRFFYYKPRPFSALQIQPLIDHNITSSFPSGHAAAYFALALAIFYFDKKWGGWALSMGVLMGAGRIFTGLHWPLDILAGALIGLVTVFLLKRFFPEIRENKIIE